MASSTLDQVATDSAQDSSDVLAFLYHDLKWKLNQGVEEPVVSFLVASVLGLEGIEALKHKLEAAFGVSMEVDVDLIANTLKVLPVMPTQDEMPVPDASTEGKELDKKKFCKVPRPPNAFILYRKEWHPLIVAANPGLHNNRISIMLGEKWRGETQAVRDEYKLKAALAKKEHAVLHPNYTYQPRKPSEKKRRMTKSKLARLAALAQSHFPMLDLAQNQGYASFGADADYGNTLVPQLESANAAYPHTASDFVAHSLINTSDDAILEDVAHFSFNAPVTASSSNSTDWADMMDVLTMRQTPFYYSSDTTLPGPAHRGGDAIVLSKVDQCAEIERQARLQDELNALFDFESATASLPSADDFKCETGRLKEPPTVSMLTAAYANGFTV